MLKRKVLYNLIRLKELTKSLKLDNYNNCIEESYNKLQNNVFTLTILGEFSSGKSTFINSLLGSKILPATVRPTTATINIIKHSDDANGYAIVYYKDKKQAKKISIEQLKQYSAPSDNEEYRATPEFKKLEAELRSIKWIEILYPTGFCKNGVEIVDTPGVNDLDESREEITYQFIPKSDAVILILDFEQPLSASELTFLKDRILKDVTKLFFIINKTDHSNNEKELKETIDYVRKELSKVINNPKIFPFSSKLALKAKENNDPETLKQSFYEDFEKELFRFLASDRGRTILINPVNKGLSIIKELNNFAINELKSLDKSIEELEEKIAKFEPIRKEAIARQKKLNYYLKQELDQLADKIEIDFRKDVDNIKNNIISKIDSYEKDSESLQRVIPKWIKKNIANLINSWQDYLNQSKEIIEKKIYAQIQDIVSEVDAFAAKEFYETQYGIDITSKDISELSNTLNNYINDEEVKNFVESTALGFIGGFLLGPIGIMASMIGSYLLVVHREEKIKEQIKRKVVEVLDEFKQNISGIFANKIEQFYTDFKNQINVYLDSHINSINRAMTDVLKLKKEQQAVVERQKSIIQNNIMNLNNISKDLLMIKEKIGD